jgi:hypothetical protein
MYTKQKYEHNMQEFHMTGNIDMQLLDIVTLKGLPDHVMVFLCIQIAIDKMLFCLCLPIPKPSSQHKHQQTDHPHDTIHMVCGCQIL